MLSINGLDDALAVESGYEEGCRWGAIPDKSNRGLSEKRSEKRKEVPWEPNT